MNKERRGGEPRKEFEYPTAEEFDSMKWLEIHHAIITQTFRVGKTTPNDAQSDQQKHNFFAASQYGYSPTVPLARIGIFHEKFESTWYLTPDGWACRKLPLPDKKTEAKAREVLVAQLSEHLATDDIGLEPTRKLLDANTRKELHERGFAGLNTKVSDEEMNHFVKTTLDRTWEAIEEKKIPGFTSKKAFLEDMTKNYEEGEILDMMEGECEVILNTVAQRSEDTAHITIGIHPRITVQRYTGDEAPVYTISMPEYDRDGQVEKPNAVTHYMLKNGEFLKRRVSYMRLPDGSLPMPETQITFDKIDQKVQPNEQLFVHAAVAQHSRLASDIQHTLAWARDGEPFAIRTEKETGGSTVRRVKKDKHGNIMAVDLTEHVPLGKTPPAGGTLHEATVLRVYSPSVMPDEEPYHGFLVVYYPDKALIDVEVRGIRISPSEMKSQIDSLRKHVEKTSDTVFPKNTKLSLNTATTYLSVADYPSFHAATDRMRRKPNKITRH